MSAKVLELPESDHIYYVNKSLTSWGAEGADGVNSRTAPYYDREQIKNAMDKHFIRAPFDKVVTRTDGVSTCQYCKTKYSGHQMFCTNEIWWMNVKSIPDNYDRGWKRGDKMLGEIHLAYPYIGCKNPDKMVVFATRRSACGSQTDWDLISEFNDQQEFFKFVDFVNSLNPDVLNYLTKYREALPPGTANEYRILYLENQLSLQNMRIEHMENFVKMMAEKMNNAGHSLIF